MYRWLVSNRWRWSLLASRYFRWLWIPEIVVKIICCSVKPSYDEVPWAHELTDAHRSSKSTIICIDELTGVGLSLLAYRYRSDNIGFLELLLKIIIYLSVDEVPWAHGMTNQTNVPTIDSLEIHSSPPWGIESVDGNSFWFVYLWCSWWLRTPCLYVYM